MDTRALISTLFYLINPALCNFSQCKSNVKPQSNILRLIKDTYNCNCQPFFKDQPSVLKFTVWGRIGNKMLAYAFTTSVKKHFGLKTYLEDDTINELKNVLNIVDNVEPLSRICNEEFPWDHSFKDPIIDLDQDMLRGKAIYYYPVLNLMGQILNKSLKFDQLMEPFEDDIRLALQLQDKFLNKADDILRSISSRKKKKSKTFVGVHVRRGDSDQHLADRYGYPVLTPAYYHSAIQRMISLLKVPSKSLTFVVVSDDHKWAKEKLIKNIKGLNMVLAGTGNPQYLHQVILDMAILSRCNHTIQSYGTFSFWAGFLSGGQKVTPGMIFSNSVPSKKKPFMMPDDGLSLKVASTGMQFPSHLR